MGQLLWLVEQAVLVAIVAVVTWWLFKKIMGHRKERAERVIQGRELWNKVRLDHAKEMASADGTTKEDDSTTNTGPK